MCAWLWEGRKSEAPCIVPHPMVCAITSERATLQETAACEGLRRATLHGVRLPGDEDSWHSMRLSHSAPAVNFSRRIESELLLPGANKLATHGMR